VLLVKERGFSRVFASVIEFSLLCAVLLLTSGAGLFGVGLVRVIRSRKPGVLLGSFAAGGLGYLFLRIAFEASAAV
jgi:hypothetical protein